MNNITIDTEFNLECGKLYQSGKVPRPPPIGHMTRRDIKLAKDAQVAAAKNSTAE